MAWYADWFASPYYSLLYRNRDQREAAAFIQTLIGHWRLPGNARVLDLACGDGRHSECMAAEGLRVVGIDLSPRHIAYARQHRQPRYPERLAFHQGDMRQLDYCEEFAAVLNLFTSFGYFDDNQANRQVLEGVYAALQPGGRFCLDYLNAERVRLNPGQPEEQLEVEGVQFSLKRRIAGDRVLKDIRVTDGATVTHFQESVQLLRLADFEALFQEIGLQLQQVWGDYPGNPYQPADSPRLILLAQRT